MLIWNSLPKENFAPADIVLGQPDFQTNSAGTTRRKMNFPSGISTDGKMLFVSEENNHRVLVFHGIPTENFAPAGFVLGQKDFNSGGSGVGSDRLNQPVGIAFDGKRLFVADLNNHRVLIFNIGTSAIDLSPQFKQGKAVLGKVFWDLNGNGRQDRVLPSLPGTLPRKMTAHLRNKASQGYESSQTPVSMP